MVLYVQHWYYPRHVLYQASCDLSVSSEGSTIPVEGNTAKCQPPIRRSVHFNHTVKVHRDPHERTETSVRWYSAWEIKALFHDSREATKDDTSEKKSLSARRRLEQAYVYYSNGLDITSSDCARLVWIDWLCTFIHAPTAKRIIDENS